MAVNYASKYADKIEKVFTLGSLTEAAVNKNYSWVGVEAINVLSIVTQPLKDYSLTGANRFGNPAELQNTKQTMLLTRDRSFSITIDRKTLDDTNGAITAGVALKAQIDEQVTPEIDTYRLGVMGAAAEANGSTATEAITANNAYSSFLAGQETLGNAKVPLMGRIAFVSYGFYSFVKQSPGFMLASELSKNELINGVVGKIDGVKIVAVPASYLPEDTAFIITHPAATVGPMKLTEYNVHTKPQGISGALIEGRVRYDAFVLEQKKNAIYSHKTANNPSV